MSEEIKKLTLIGYSTCPNCDVAKEILTRDGKMDKINYIDETSAQFEDIVASKKIDAFPTFLFENKVCNLTGTTDKYNLKCDDGSEMEI